MPIVSTPSSVRGFNVVEVVGLVESAVGALPLPVHAVTPISTAAPSARRCDRRDREAIRRVTRATLEANRAFSLTSVPDDLAANPAGDPVQALLDAARPVVGPWAERTIVARLGTASADLVDDQLTRTRIAALADELAGDILAALGELLLADVETQRINPLALIRQRVGPANALLIELGVRPPDRDEFDRQRFPDDPFGIGPVTWADIDPTLHEPGLMWGIWKAHTLMQRRRASDP